MMGRARQGGLLIHLVLLLLLGYNASAQQLRDIYYSNTHQDAFEKPFENDSIIIFTPATGLTDNGTALCLTQRIPLPNDTSVNPDAAGRALVKTPVRVRDPVTKNVLSFNTMFSFWIQSDTAYDPGQGLAFIISPDNSSSGSPGMYLGWLSSSTNGNTTGRFAVEFDTVRNTEFGDIDRNHVGVNVNNLRSICYESAGYWEAGQLLSLNLTTTAEELVYVWIDYDGPRKMLAVTISNRTARPQKALLTCDIDLTEYLLQDDMYVGFTASTGRDSLGSHMSQHSVYEWSFGIGNRSAINLFGTDTISNSSALPASSESKSIVVPLAAGITGGACSLFILLVVGILYCRNHGRNDRSLPVTELSTLNSVRGPEKFSYSQLSSATKSFSKKTQIGEGGFGSVHRGVLPNRGEVLAVKRISKTSKQGAKEFVAEVKVIGRVRHRNLVPLLGWCHHAARGELLLVYEFMPNGSLDQLLFKNDQGEVLSWERRLKIICGVGSALAFLHDEWEQRVVHRDVKASNVMLDADFNARLGDFGLARSYEHSQLPRSTKIVAGTVGYMAPELFNNGKPTEKTDVYSFGALALEIATGFLACGTPPDKAKTLVDWVWALFRDNRLLDAADVRLDGKFDPDEMSVLLQVGLLCSHPDEDSRPTMRQSLAMLKGEVPLRCLPLTKPLPSFAFSISGSESILGIDTTDTLSDFQNISLSSPNTGSTSRSSDFFSQQNDTVTSPR